MIGKRTLSDRAPALRRRLQGTPEAGACLVRRAVTAEDFDEACRLADRAGASGSDWRRIASAPCPLGRTTADTVIFVAEAAGRPVGVLAAVPDAPDRTLPGDTVFGRELDLLRCMGTRIAEVTHVAFAPGVGLDVLGALWQACVAWALDTGCDELFVGVAGHYERLLDEALAFERWDLQRETAAGDRFYGKRFSVAGAPRRLLLADARLGADAFLVNFFLDANPYRTRAAAKPSAARTTEESLAGAAVG